MTIVRKWVGAIASGVPSATPVAGGSFVANDAIILFTYEPPGSDTISTPSGWTQLDLNANTHQLRLFGLISVTGSEAMPTITWGTTGHAHAVVTCYSGVDTSFTTGAAAADRASNSTSSINCSLSSRTPSVDGCLALCYGLKRKTSASDGATLSPPSSFTTVIDTVPSGSTEAAAALTEWIQTTATIINANPSIVSSIADATNQSTQGALVILQPATTPDNDPVRSGRLSLPVYIYTRDRPKAYQQDFSSVPLTLSSIPPPTPPPSDLEFPAFLRKAPSNVYLGIEQGIPRPMVGTDRVLTPVDWLYGWPSPLERMPVALRAMTQGLDANAMTALTTFPPYQEYNWPVPPGPRQWNRGFVYRAQVQLLGKDNIPLAGIQNLSWDPPRGAPRPIANLTWLQSGLALSQTVQVRPPISVSDWPVPRAPRRSVQDFIQGTPPVMMDFLTTFPPFQPSVVRPVIRVRSPAYDGFIGTSTLLLGLSQIFPPGDQLTDSFGRFGRSTRSRGDIYSISLRSPFLTPVIPPPSITPSPVAGPGGRIVLMPKKQGETVTRPFDFISRLGAAEVILNAQVTASVYSGTDSNPSSIINGGASFVGTIVYQSLTGGITGVTYELLCKVTTSLGQVLEIGAFWTVEPDLP